MKWSDNEFSILKKYYPIGGYELVNKHLYVKRTRISIVHKAIHSNITMNNIDKHNIFSIQGTKVCKDIYNNKNPNWKNGISENNYHYKNYKKLQVKKYPDHIKAMELVKRAIKSGKLIKGTCIICGCKDVVAHHTDYSKPLDVIWMCRKHHRELHDGKIELPNKDK